MPLLLLLFTILGCSVPHANSDGKLSEIRMTTDRAAHSATLLEDGCVLLAGGISNEGRGETPVASCELYDPRKGKFIESAPMADPRCSHTATKLKDGRVLVAGGWTTGTRTSSIEIYDHTLESFSVIGNMQVAAAGHCAVMLQNGDVLLCGGDIARGHVSSRAEVYQPDRGEIVKVGDMVTGRSMATATLLSDGRVLIVGGQTESGQVTASAEIFDPATGTFADITSANMKRYKHAAVALGGDSVLIIGGSDEHDWSGLMKSVELFVLSKGAFELLGEADAARFKFSEAATLLSDGRVLLGGGGQVVEVFDPLAGKTTWSTSIGAAYYYMTATVLADKTILLAGGYDRSIECTSKAWVIKT